MAVADGDAVAAPPEPAAATVALGPRFDLTSTTVALVAAVGGAGLWWRGRRLPPP